MPRKKKNEDEMLENEQIQTVLNPHPLSFMKLQSICLFLIIWSVIVLWLVNFSEYKSMFNDPIWIVVMWGIVLILAGVIISLISIKWTVFFLYLTVFISAIILMLWQNWFTKDIAPIFIPCYSVAASIIGFLIVEMHRRSHKYIVTNLRVILLSGVLTKTELSIRYDKMTVFGTQTILGQIFNFGTIIPITQSGLGLGSDQTLAGGGVMLGGKKAKLLGLAGGGKEVHTPRSRSAFELHGIYPYSEVKKHIEKMVQESVPTAYHQEQIKFQKEQVDIQKQMRDLLKNQTKSTGEKPVKAAAAKQIEEKEEEEDEEEKEQAFQPEQIDIQQQMKELLKKQGGKKEENEEEENTS